MNKNAVGATRWRLAMPPKPAHVAARESRAHLAAVEPAIDILPAALPADALDDRIAIVGTAGSGKTYAAKGFVERLLDSGPRRDVTFVPRSSERLICRCRGQIRPESDGRLRRARDRIRQAATLASPGMVPLCLLLRDSPTSNLVDSLRERLDFHIKFIVLQTQPAPINQWSPAAQVHDGRRCHCSTRAVRMPHPPPLTLDEPDFCGNTSGRQVARRTQLDPTTTYYMKGCSRNVPRQCLYVDSSEGEA
jgi:hypothetical protein